MKKAILQWALIVALTTILTAVGGMFNVLPTVVFCYLELVNSTSINHFNQLEWIGTDKYKTANIITAYIIGIPLLIIPSGILTLKFKNTDKIALWGLTVGAFIVTIPGFALAVALNKGSYPLLFSIRLIQGIGSGIGTGYFVPCTQIVTPARWLTTVLAVTTQMFRIGAVLAIVFEGKLCTANHWLINLYIWPGISFVACSVWSGLIYVFVRACKANAVLTPSAAPQGFCQQVRLLMGKREIYLLAFGAFAGQANTIMYFAYLPKFFIDVYDLPLSKNYFQSVLPILVAFVVVIGLSFCIEMLSKKFTVGVTLKISNMILSLISAAMLILMLLKIATVTVVVVLQIVGCCTASLFLVLLFRGMSECLPKSSAAASIVGCLGTIGYIASSYIITLVPTLGSIGWPIIFGSLATLEVLAAIGFLFIRMPSVSHTPEKPKPKITTQGAQHELSVTNV